MRKHSVAHKTKEPAEQDARADSKRGRACSEAFTLGWGTQACHRLIWMLALL
jgi:hypothetical protein